MKSTGDKAKKRRIILLVIDIVLIIVAVVCCIFVSSLSKLLPWQNTASRWQGESERSFSQVACYLPVDEEVTIPQIYDFRTAMLTKFHDAALDIDNDDILFSDAWSTTGKVSVSSETGKGTASVIAVGGNFFDFHPITLLDGNYLSPNDVMEDRVLLDEELAWLLFGGTELQGMQFKIEGVPFVVAGVIERETDFASSKAYTSGMGLYMSYEAYSKLFEDAGISCYEIVMPEPVGGFAYNAVKDKFPIGGGDIIDISSRYSFDNLARMVTKFGSRSMQTLGVVNPYWENAARCTEDWCALLVLIAVVSAALPCISVLVVTIKYLVYGKRKLEEDVIPTAVEKTEEKIRVHRRRAWEKKQGKHSEN